jgi:hypothetical protein
VTRAPGSELDRLTGIVAIPLFSQQSFTASLGLGQRLARILQNPLRE